MNTKLHANIVKTQSAKGPSRGKITFVFAALFVMLLTAGSVWVNHQKNRNDVRPEMQSPGIVNSRLSAVAPVVLPTAVAGITRNTEAKTRNNNAVPANSDQIKRKISESFAKAPVSFTKNVGQWQNDVFYKGRVLGMNISYLKNGLSYGFSRDAKNGGEEQLVWNQVFEGMNKNAEIIGEGSTEEVVSYIIGVGEGTSRTHSNIPNCSELNYLNVYDNINVKYYGNPSSPDQLETDFILKPGADVNDIRVRFDGIKNLSVDKKGVLVVNNAWGALREYIPSSYQVINGEKKEVSVKYKLIDRNTYSFEVCGIYDPSNELVIDPVILQWATFAGPSSLIPGQPGFMGHENKCEIYDLECDNLGFTYAVGWCQDSYPTNVGTYQKNVAGQADVIVLKLNVAATALVWATYIGTTNGGSAAQTDGESGWGIDIDNEGGGGNVYVTGLTDRNTFPTTPGAFQTTFTGTTAAFALKINPTGTALVYSTFLGNNSGGRGIEVLPSGNVVVGGYTGAGFPTTPGCFQPALKGGIDGFIATLNPAGSALIYSTYIGGTKNDTVWRLSTDLSDNAYASGTTNSVNFPTLGAYQAALNGTANDAFVFKMTPAGALVYSTYFGGTLNDVGYGIDVNTAGEAYLCGGTLSTNLPTLNPFQASINGPSDAFLTKFNASGSGLIYSTYLGGTQKDCGYDVVVNCKDQAFANGFTGIPNKSQTTGGAFPLTACSFYETINAGTAASPPGGNDFVAKFSPNGKLLYTGMKFSAATWQLRTAMDLVEVNCCVLGVVSGGTVGHHVTGYNYITTPGVFQETDLRWTKYSAPFFFRLTPKVDLTLNIITKPTCLSTPTFIGIRQDTCWGKEPLTWSFGDGSTGTGDTIEHVYKSTGTYTVTATVSCPPATTSKVITITSIAPCGPTVKATGSAVCLGSCAVISSTPSGGTAPYTYLWSTGATAPTANVCPTVNSTYTLTLTDATGTTSATTTAVTIHPVTVLTTTKTDVKCIGQTDGTATATGSAGTAPYAYSWSTSPVQTTATAVNLAPGTYTVTSTDSNGCTQTATATVGQPIPITLATTTAPALCGSSNGSASVTTTGGTGSFKFTWTPGNGTTATFTGLSNGTYTVTASDANNCTATTTAVVNSIGGATVTVQSVTNILCFGGNNGSASITVAGGTPAYTINWTPTGGTGTNPTSLIAGTYTVQVTDANNCQQVTTVVITEPPVLTAVANSVSPLCPGNGSTSVTAAGGSPGYTYNWMPGGAASPTVTGLGGGVYTVTVTDVNGCTVVSSASITTPPAIVASISPVDGTCGLNNGSASIIASGGTPGYSFNWAPTGGNGPTAGGLGANTYTVTVTDSKGCTQTTTAIVGNSPPVALAASVTANVSCAGGNDGSAIATVGGGTAPISYAWSPVGGSGVAASGLPAGNYTVNAVDAKGCTAVSNVTITEPPPLTLSATGPGKICIGQSATLTATANGGTASYNYTWMPGSQSGASININPTVATTYTVTVIDSKGCTSSSTVAVNVNPPLQVDAGLNQKVCSGGSTTAIATAAGGDGNYTYTWLPSNTIGATLNVTPSGSQTYTVVVTDGCGTPPATDVVTLIGVNPVLTPSFTPDSTSGCAPLSVSFNNTTTGGVTQSCSWDFGDGSTSNDCAPTYLFRKPGTYNIKLTVTDTNGCSTSLTRTKSVKVYPIPTAGFTADPRSASILTPTINFTDKSSSDVVQWDWSLGDAYNSSSTKKNPSHTYKDTGRYEIQLIVTNQYGCKDTATDYVIIHGDYTFYVPNAFSPNGDGKNETFFPTGFMINPECFKMIIFDRWGNLIFETEDLNVGWDGRANGGKDIAQQDVYVWKILTCDYMKHSYRYIGHVTLVK
ncbi:MAG: PKD domain-containing protein [Bacteroidia bacterium]|nr:PKD domain-containing protein [Bacteroidia bacterium]